MTPLPGNGRRNMLCEVSGRYSATGRIATIVDLWVLDRVPCGILDVIVITTVALSE